MLSDVKITDYTIILTKHVEGHYSWRVNLWTTKVVPSFKMESILKYDTQEAASKDCKELLTELGIINMKELANEIVAWLKNYAESSNRKAFVVGVSGGVDSALVSTLCAMTQFPTHCVVLPCNTKEDQTDRGNTHMDWLGSRFAWVYKHKIDLSDTFNAFHATVNESYNNELAYANTKSRLRMTALYQVATVVDGLVVGTGNKVEDNHIFFYTKYGDGGVDISPIGDLTKTEVRQMSRELGILPELSEAVATDGLWDDTRTDEDAIGASYEELEWAMEYAKFPNPHHILLHPRQKEVLAISEKWNKAGKHKSLPIPVYMRGEGG
jgi:NAD+ synthase